MTGTYSYWLVVLSVLVATLASYTALDLATRITAAKGRAAILWLLGGAFSMGTGIWSMHFIGMLAFRLPIPMGYDVPVTLLSMLIAIVVSGFALFIVSRDTLGARNLLDETPEFAHVGGPLGYDVSQSELTRRFVYFRFSQCF